MVYSIVSAVAEEASIQEWISFQAPHSRFPFPGGTIEVFTLAVTIFLPGNFRISAKRAINSRR